MYILFNILNYFMIRVKYYILCSIYLELLKCIYMISKHRKKNKRVGI